MTGHSLRTRIKLLAVLVLMTVGGSCFAQTVALKTNLVSDALASPNLGIELGEQEKCKSSIFHIYLCRKKRGMGILMQINLNDSKFVLQILEGTDMPQILGINSETSKFPLLRIVPK